MVQNDSSKHILSQIEEKMFNKNNTITGIGSVVDLFGIQSFNRYDNFSDEHNASVDYGALKSDWITTENDVSRAVELFVSLYGYNIKNRVRIDD